jgi:hypothetical protein
MKVQSALDKVSRLVQSNEQPVATGQHPTSDTLASEHIDIALAEAGRSPRLCLYSPKVVAILTYLKLTNPELVMSRVVTRHLEDSFAQQYPVLWNEISTAVNAKRRADWSKRKKMRGETVSQRS